MFRISKRARKIAKTENISFRDASAIISYYGWIKHSNSYNFYRNYIKPYASIKEMKKVVSNYAKGRK